MWGALGRPPREPEGVVAKYFAALADRHADEARRLLARSENESLETVLLDNRTIEHADYTPPSNVAVERLPSPSALSAGVQVRYRIAGVAYERDLRLVRGAPHAPWRILGGWSLLPANTRTSYPSVVAGTVVPKSDSPSVPAFPGPYVVFVPG